MEIMCKRRLYFRSHRSVPYPESGPAGIWWELQGEGQSAGEHSRHFQCIQRLLGWSSENWWDRGAHGDGAGQRKRWTGSAQWIILFTVKNRSTVPAQLLYLWLDIFVHQNKMQTDQDEQQNQGDSPKEPEEKPRENEEMEVRSSVLCSISITHEGKVAMSITTYQMIIPTKPQFLRWCVEQLSVLCYDLNSELNLESL